MRCLTWMPGLTFAALIGAAHAAPPTEAARADLDPAARALVEGAPAQAVALARGILRAKPDDLGAMKTIGTASCLLRDPVNARLAAERLSDADQRALEELCAKHGVVLAARGAQRPHPLLGSPVASRLYAEGILLMARGDLVRAERLLRRAHRREAAPQILFEIARCQVLAGELKRAVATHRRYVLAFHTPAQRLAAAVRFSELQGSGRAARRECTVSPEWAPGPRSSAPLRYRSTATRSPNKRSILTSSSSVGVTE